MLRRQFVKHFLAVGAWVHDRATGRKRLLSPVRLPNNPSQEGVFPITVQWSPLPNRHPAINSSQKPADKHLLAKMNDIIEHGFTGLQYPLHLPRAESVAGLRDVQARDMFLTYNRTFEKGGVENFGRKSPPPISVFSPRYAEAVRKNVIAAFAPVKGIPNIYNVFCYHDEPFHAGPESFDYSEDVKRAFKKRYGYGLPPDIESARKNPRVWLDVINFRSHEFPVGWRQAYKIIKQIEPNVRVIITDDSHSAFGGGVRSNSKMAVDDVFYWGADFADTFVFDIYPYMMFDFRYGECGKLRKPRLSQMHYAFGQMRNLTYTYGKELGFWFGTFNKRWFAKFMGPKLKAQYWIERETSFTAVAQGANFLITGYEIPEDACHWKSLGEGLRVIQKAGTGLLKAPKKKAKACFMFPRTQYIQLQEEYWNVGLSYELFLRAFGELDVLHEKQVWEGSLDEYQILALFDVRLLPDNVARRIEGFVRRGGTVISDCVPNLNADMKPSRIMGDLFGVRDAVTRRIRRSGIWVPTLVNPHWFIPPLPGNSESAVVKGRVSGTAFNRRFDFRIVSPRQCKAVAGEVLLETASGHPALVRRHVGEGQVFLLGFCVQDSYFQTWKDSDSGSRAQLRDILYRITESAGIRSHIYSSNPDIEAALRINSEEGYVFVINHEAKSSETHVRLADLEFMLDRVIDLTRGGTVGFDRTSDGASFDITVSQTEPRLLHLLPRRVQVSVG